MFVQKPNLAKSFIKSNPDILFTTANKGNVTICLKSPDYNTKLSNLLSDTSTYRLLKRSPLSTIENIPFLILRQLNENELLNRKYHKRELTLTNTVLAEGYGLLKIHKQNNPLRHTIFLIGSPTHFLAKVLYNKLKKSILLI